jgi:3',5'-cyclic AMP phosphodiesterase CpdA
MNTITWLHLSDFHFRTDEQHVWNENIVLEALLDDVRGRMAEDGLYPDFVVVSGDLAFSGQPAEYDLAGTFFDDLLQATSLGKERLFLVPGNHDVDRRAISRGAQAVTDALDDRDAVNAVLSTPGDRQLVLARFQGYAGFVNGYLARHLPFNDEGYYYVKTVDLTGQRLALLGLNSAWVAASDQDRAQGLLLGERQTRTALREADDTGATLKLALLHHPLDWLREFDQNDSGTLLLDRCDFLLHGHLHQTATAQLTSPDGAATILACGACYKTRKSPNMYNWVRLDLDAGTGTVYLRRYSDARGGFWAPDTLTYRNVTNGEYTFALRGQATAIPSVPSNGSPSSAAERGIAAGREESQAEPDTQKLLAGLRIDADNPPYAALRALLLEAFTPDDLRRFCQDRSGFRPVLNNIGSGASANEIVDALFELCRTRLRWDELLAELVQIRPEQVTKYADRLRADGD